MIKLEQLSLRRGHRLLFSAATLQIHPGQKVGLTGANGTGKSSLFGLICGELQPDTGTISVPETWDIAHVAQDMPDSALSAIDYVLQGDQEYMQLQHELAYAQETGDGQRLSVLHDRLAAIDGYSAQSRAGKLLHGLGFSSEDEQKAVRAFSGGWRMRLNLAQALMCRSDCLLLDEPTNHLDLDAVYWLEEWLRHYPGTLLLISHDRDFLDRVVTQIIHIEHQQVRMYTGNYSDFEQTRAQHLAHQQAAYQKQKREIDQIRQFVVRFKAKATKAKQAQSRLKALARMEQIAPAHIDSPFRFQFFAPSHLTTPLLVLEKAAAGYRDMPVITEATLTLSPGDRIGLLGPNGAGKSTLIKLIAGELPPLTGKRKIAKACQIAYFAQHQLEQLVSDESPLQHLQRLDRQAKELELRQFLGGFGFHDEQALSPVAPFSGGEKARLVLALLVYQKPAVLLLDEPTNHLDLEMRLALTLALQSFEGALVVVSHDRHLLRTVVDEFWLVADGNIRAFDGDLTAYRQWLQSRDSLRSLQSESSSATVTGKKADRRMAALARQKLRPFRQAVAEIEQAIDQVQMQLEQVEAKLADNRVYDEQEKETLRTLLREQGELKVQLARLETDWFAASEALQQAEQA